MSKFKGNLRFIKKSDEPCYLIKDGKIVGKGVYMVSSGQIFKIKYASPAQELFAKKIQKQMGLARVHGCKEGDYIKVGGLSYPLSRSAQRNKLERIRCAQAMEGGNEAFTGHHRSGDKKLPGIIKGIQVRYGKKED